MKKFLPNVSPLTFSGSAIIVGYLLIDDFTATQQVAISSWLGLVSDVLSANASWLAVIEERQEFIKTSKQELDDEKNKDDKKNDDDKDAKKSEDELELILKTLEKMKKDIQNLKNQKQE